MSTIRHEWRNWGVKIIFLDHRQKEIYIHNKYSFITVFLFGCLSKWIYCFLEMQILAITFTSLKIILMIARLKGKKFIFITQSTEHFIELQNMHCCEIYAEYLNSIRHSFH